MPVFVVVPALLWLDRFEAEPTALLLFAFGWGAAVATLIAVLVNSTSIALLKASGGDVTVGAVVIAPIVEETCKGLAVLLVFLYRRREFDGVVDGIVYAGMAGIGFAFTENVLYLGRALADSGVDGLAATFVLRCLFGPFAHPLFTMATGVGFGIAVTTPPAWAPRTPRPVLGWLVAVTLHGLWNLSAVAGLRGFVSAYVVLQVPIFLAALGVRPVVAAARGPADRPAPGGVRRDRLAHAGRGARCSRRCPSAGEPARRRAARGGPAAARAMRALPGRGERAGAAAGADDPRRRGTGRPGRSSATCSPDLSADRRALAG